MKMKNSMYAVEKAWVDDAGAEHRVQQRGGVVAAEQVAVESASWLSNSSPGRSSGTTLLRLR